MNSLNDLPLFAYGSLMLGQCNDFMVKTWITDSCPAQLPGILRLRPEGYPALELSGHFGQAGTPGLQLPSTPTTYEATAQELVSGQLLWFRSSPQCWPHLDRFEGFEFGQPSDYLRVLVAARRLPESSWLWAWTYIAPESLLAQVSWPRIPYWPPPDAPEPEPYQPTVRRKTADP